MTDRKIPARFGRFLLDHLLLWILAIMILAVVGTIFVAPQTVLVHPSRDPLQWPQTQRP